MRNSRFTRFLIAMTVLFFVCFSGYHAFRHLHSPYRVENVRLETVGHSVTAEALLIRDEVLLGRNPGGFLRPLVRDGEKVRKGSPVGTLYPDADGAERARLAEADRRELGLLEALRGPAGEDPGSLLEMIQEDIFSAVSGLSDDLAAGRYREIARVRSALQESVSRKAVLTGHGRDVEERLRELRSRLSVREEGTPVTSSETGYYSRTVDLLEPEIRPEMLSALTPGALESLLGRKTVFSESHLGKIVRSEEWYLAALLTRREADGYPVGSEISLSFPGCSGTLSCVVCCRRDEKGRDDAAVIFRSNEVNREVVTRRVSPVTISSRPRWGIRLDAELLHIVDGTKGVYCVDGNRVCFRRTDIIYAGNGFYLSRPNPAGRDFLSPYDKVIVTGRPLRDGMALDDI